MSSHSNLEYMRVWRSEHRDKTRMYAHKNYLRYRERKIKATKLRKEKNPDLFRLYARRKSIKAKLEVIRAYGGRCACCGESQFEFLTIDHINGRGRSHRKELRLQRGCHFYTWLKKWGFPKDEYRLLCMNCNFSYGHYKYCPHSLEDRDIISETLSKELLDRTRMREEDERPRRTKIEATV